MGLIINRMKNGENGFLTLIKSTIEFLKRDPIRYNHYNFNALVRNPNNCKELVKEIKKFGVKVIKINQDGGPYFECAFRIVGKIRGDEYTEVIYRRTGTDDGK